MIKIDFINSLLILIASLNIALGLSIFTKGYKKKINVVYTINIIAIVSWIVAMILFRSAPLASNMFWCTILYITPTFIASTFLSFTYIFPSIKDERLLIKNILIFTINIIVVILIALPDFIIVDVIPRPGREKAIIFSKYYFIYFLYISSFFTFGLFRLYNKYLKASGVERSQILYLMLGYAISTNLAFVTNLILPWLGIFSLNWLGQVSTIFMVSFTVYAIVAHHLMDIKVVLRKFFVFTATLISLLIPVIIVEYLIYTYYHHIKFLAWMRINLGGMELIDFLVIILAILFFPKVQRYYYYVANKYFFSSLYDSQQVIGEVSDKLRSTLNLNEIFVNLKNIIVQAFHIKTFFIFIYQERLNVYKIQYYYGYNAKNNDTFPLNNGLEKNLILKNNPIVIEDLKKKSFEGNYKIDRKIDNFINSAEIDVIIPLNVKDKKIGLIALGPKESKDAYSAEDLQVLNIISMQASTAIENAILYRKTEKFNVELRRRISLATRKLSKTNKELTVANENLMQLDKAKSEFISIASHQLRTPLTVIKGYTSMILENSFGKVPKEMKDPLVKVHQSGDRLIQLVENMLNVSRIESERLQYSYNMGSLEKIVGSVVGELENVAKLKKIKLTYYKPDGQLSHTKMDEEKIRQVVLNLIDNAIKYTKKGTVSVYLKEVKLKKTAYLQFMVSDSGIGISPEDMQKLFKKFSRGQDTALVNTEGTGLGLYVAKKMIEAHQGTIWVESDGINKGSKFYFMLPVTK